MLTCSVMMSSTKSEVLEPSEYLQYSHFVLLIYVCHLRWSVILGKGFVLKLLPNDVVVLAVDSTL